VTTLIDCMLNNCTVPGAQPRVCLLKWALIWHSCIGKFSRLVMTHSTEPGSPGSSWNNLDHLQIFSIWPVWPSRAQILSKPSICSRIYCWKWPDLWIVDPSAHLSSLSLKAEQHLGLQRLMKPSCFIIPWLLRKYVCFLFFTFFFFF